MVTLLQAIYEATIRYFDQANAAEARKWLLEAERPVAITT